MVDRISELPYELLVSILSLLSLKEAVSTSILSRQWRYVWGSIMILDFDVSTTLIGYNKASRWQRRRRFVDCMNTVVEQYRGISLQKFRVSFDTDDSCTSSITKWVQFAMENSVQKLHLDFIGMGIQRQCTFPTLPGCIVSESLKNLELISVDVTGEDIEYVLSNCPALEQLTIKDSNLLINLRVAAPSIALQKLEIKYCKSLKNIQICDANLVSFIYYGMFDFDLLLSNVPFLVEVCIWNNILNCYDLAPTRFIDLALTQLQTLKLDMARVIYDENLVLPILENLKYLELKVEADCLSLLASFMEASPYLQKLVLHLACTTTKPSNEIKTAAKFPHRHLKVVEIVGYRFCGAAQAVVYLRENAVALEKIIIDGVEFCMPWFV